MKRWLGPRQAHGFGSGPPEFAAEQVLGVTDDPLAAIDPLRKGQKIYSVSRSVYLPRVTLKNGDVVSTEASGSGINPLFAEPYQVNAKPSPTSQKPNPKTTPVLGSTNRQGTPQSGGKSSSSGYGGSQNGSNHDHSNDEPGNDEPSDHSLSQSPLSQSHLSQSHLSQSHLSQTNRSLGNHIHSQSTRKTACNNQNKHNSNKHNQTKHNQTKHNQSKHNQSKHSQNKHIQNNHIQNNHIQNNHIQNNHIQNNHIQNNHIQNNHFQNRRISNRGGSNHAIGNREESNHTVRNHAGINRGVSDLGLSNCSLSSHDLMYTEALKLSEDAVAILERNAGFVKSIQVATRPDKKLTKRNKSLTSSSGAGTLTTIQEGIIDFTIPRPIWPKFDDIRREDYDSLLDEAFMLYTSLNYVPDNLNSGEGPNHFVDNFKHFPNGLRYLSDGLKANGLRSNGFKANGLNSNGVISDGVISNDVISNDVISNGDISNGLHSNRLHSEGLHSDGLITNGLIANELISNGLTSNGLTSNGLTSNGLTSNGLTSNGLTCNLNPDGTNHFLEEVSVKEILVELLNSINATIEGKSSRTPEEMLKLVNERIALSLEALKNSTEEEMRRLCLNLRNSKKVSSVVRAFGNSAFRNSALSTSGISHSGISHSGISNSEISNSGISHCGINNSPLSNSPLSNCPLSNSPLRNSGISNSAFSNSTSSGNSSQCSPEWSSERVRTVSSENEEIYQIPSGSSSSGFSDSVKHFETNRLPVFVHEDLSSVPNGMRNAMIYGTLSRTNFKSGQEKLLEKDVGKSVEVPAAKKSLLRATEDSKPSVWEQYYGVRAERVVDATYVPKPTDIPLFPGGRPEADFTLDVPRSELLSKRMKADKKWRCRCRLLTSFLGLVFFLLSVMAVSLMLTRGKRMFGSMV